MVDRVTDRVGRARRASGTRSKIARTGRPSSRSTSTCPFTSSTTPPFTASTRARSRVSAPVAGLVRTSVIVSPTAFSIRLDGLSRS